MREPLPLATIQDAVLQFLRGRDDAVLFGAQAVNAYVDEPRMSQDIDLYSTRAKQLAEELRDTQTRIRSCSGSSPSRRGRYRSVQSLEGLGGSRHPADGRRGRILIIIQTTKHSVRSGVFSFPG